MVSSQYLLNKSEKSKKILKDLLQYFDNTLRDKKKLNLKFEIHRQDDTPLIPEIIEDDNDSIVPEQQGQVILNNIKIYENSLNKII